MPAIYVALVVRLCERFAVSAERLLEGTDLSQAGLEAPDARIPEEVTAQIVERALALTGEPGLGYYLGYLLKLSSHGSVGLACMTSATLRDALTIAERFAPLRAPGLSLRHFEDVERGEAIVELELTGANSTGRVAQFIIEALFSGLAHMANTLLGRPLRGVAEVTFAEPPHFQGFAHVLPGPMRFGQPRNRLIFPRHVLDEQLRMADDITSKQACEQCEEELRRLSATSSLLASVRRDMLTHGEGFPSLTELARGRGVSSRTLKRQLAAHDTSFQQLLDELRRDRALAMLESPHHTTEQVATALGYSDASNFTRAFRRWLGASPSAFRKRRAQG